MDYGKIIGDSWRIVWNNKFLWVLGFLAALTSVSSGGNSGRNFSQQLEQGDISPDVATAVGGVILLLLCVGILVGIVLALVSLAAQGGLIRAVADLDDGHKVTLGEAFGAGTQAIWRLFGIGLLLWLPFFLVIAAAAIAAAVAAGGFAAAAEMTSNPEGGFAALGFLAICFVALCCILIPVGIVFSVIYDFALRGTMLRQLGVVDSIRHGWQVVRTHVGEIIILMLILFVLGLLYGVLVGIILLPLGLLIIAPMAATAMSGSTPDLPGLMLLIGGGVCLGLIGAVLNSFIVAWRSAAITLAYRELTAKAV